MDFNQSPKRGQFLYCKKSKKMIFISLLVLILFLFFLDLFLTLIFSFSFFNINNKFFNIIFLNSHIFLIYKIFFKLILPHVLSIILVGLALGVAGAVLQIFLENPLADPGLLGISTGGSLAGFFGAWIFKYYSLEFGVFSYAVSALLGVFSLMLVLIKFSIGGVGERIRKTGLAGIILLGLGLNTCFSALMSLFMVFLNQENLNQLMIWSLGDFQAPDFGMVILATLLIFFGLIILFLNTQNLDKLNFGARAAFSMGVDLIKLKQKIIIALSLILAGSVILAGPIGFVGLLCPHFARFFLGTRSKILIMASGFFGVIWLLLADLISTSFLQSRVPVGAVSALIGGPIFILFLLKLGRLNQHEC